MTEPENVVSFYSKNPFTPQSQEKLDRLVIFLARSRQKPPHKLVVEGHRRMEERKARYIADGGFWPL